MIAIDELLSDDSPTLLEIINNRITEALRRQRASGREWMSESEIDDLVDGIIDHSSNEMEI